MTTICDTSGLLALFDVDEVQHEACARALPHLSGPFVVSPFVIAELDHLLRRKVGGDAARTALDELASGAYDLAPINRRQLSTCAALDEQHRDLGLGVTDASIVALAEQRDALDVLTLDQRHFRAVTRSDGRPFRLHPADTESCL